MLAVNRTLGGGRLHALVGIDAAGFLERFEHGIAPQGHRRALFGNALRLEVPALARLSHPVELVPAVAGDLVADHQRCGAGGKCGLVEDVVPHRRADDVHGERRDPTQHVAMIALA